jgi:hypothetical protein
LRRWAPFLWTCSWCHFTCFWVFGEFVRFFRLRTVLSSF